MNFRISDTFTSSLAKLTGDEQKAVKTTAFDLQMNPVNPGMQFHKLDRAKDQNFWSVRAGRDIRLIVHKTPESLLLCYVDHHDDAYRWAERRKIERHPKTGAAQLVEVRERIEEISIPKFVETEKQPEIKPPLFTEVTTEILAGFGVPPEWMNDVRKATEDSLFDLVDHLPQEAAEALIELATGGAPQPAKVISKEADSFEHPDAKRRFGLMTDVEELQRALDYPWEKWSVFLHPAQRELVEFHFNGPARISGSAGTGKTVVALHRAVFLARRYSDSRVLLTTFSTTLANALSNQLRRLIEHEPRLAERLEVCALEDIGRRLYERNLGGLRIATVSQLKEQLNNAAQTTPDHRFTARFLWSEWSDVVDAWQLKDWQKYREVPRLGRKKRISEKQRDVLWSIFEKVRAGLAAQKLITRADMFDQIASHLCGCQHPPFDFAVIDEAQDIGVTELRFLAALGAGRENSLFFTGDLGQRIFQPPFSWKALGVDIRGRSKTLKINYRTSHQIRSHADKLLPQALSDVDGNTESRARTISIFNGPPPEVKTFDTADAEMAEVSRWITCLKQEGFQPHELGVFVRSPEQMARAEAAIKLTGIPWVELNEKMNVKNGCISTCPMHLAKGLEFRAVIVMACEDQVIPLQARIEGAADESDLEEVYQTERHLLYVACTRARDKLLCTGVKPASEFLDDLSIGNDKL